MLRLCDSKIHCIEYGDLNKKDLYAYFQTASQQNNMVCVFDEGLYIGCITYTLLQQSDNVYESLQKEYLILDENIWQKGREYFVQNKAISLLPVLDHKHQVKCFAWQDEEANRELRMLWELEKCEHALAFQDLNPGYDTVTLYDCNELSWYFAEYLMKCGITVNLRGKFWKEIWPADICEVSVGKTYEIWAEGVHQKSTNWKQERLRSSSAEFECIDEIYEANIKAEKIKDANRSYKELLEKLRKECQIVIRGTGTKAQDAYDWLQANDIDICAFQSGKIAAGRKRLFGIPILRKEEIRKKFGNAVIIECSSKHSAWGFGEVDLYAYEGYERNERYILLRDYIEIPESNLKHILNRKNLIFLGDLRMCSRAYRWWKLQGLVAEEIGYWDILNENEETIKKFQIPKIARQKQEKNDICILILPKYVSEAFVTKKALSKYNVYIEKMRTTGICDYTDYFSDMEKSIHLEPEKVKYRRKELQPAGILLGAIPPFSGNLLIKQSLEGHPQIMMISEGSFLNNNLYSICIRLAEDEAKDILADFESLHQEESSSDSYVWGLYENMVKEDSTAERIPEKRKFYQKMEELLNLSDRFTAQELFVMFHIAYEAMFDKEIQNLKNFIIYWEPHELYRHLVRACAYWLESKDIRGYTLNTVRNRYIRAGSAMKFMAESDWIRGISAMYGCDYIKEKIYEYWEERTIKFEELKCRPRETLTSLCVWMGISFHDTLLETTWHGKRAFYNDITGFDTKPAHNLYEEYFTEFDRMRICLAASSYQRQYGYPFISCLNFSRRELQEMFLKSFRWEELPGALEKKDEDNMWNVQNALRHQLWLGRFAEITGIEIEEGYGVLRS